LYAFQLGRYDALPLCDLDLDLLPMKLVRVIDRGWGNLPTNFGVAEAFRSRFVGQHLSDLDLRRWWS